MLIVSRNAMETLLFHVWNYKLTLKFYARIKEYFVTHDIIAVEPRSTDTRLIWTPALYGQFL